MMVCHDLTAKNCIFFSRLFKGFHSLPSCQTFTTFITCKEGWLLIGFLVWVELFYNCEFDFLVQQRFPTSLWYVNICKNITNVKNSLHRGNIRIVEFCWFVFPSHFSFAASFLVVLVCVGSSGASPCVFLSASLMVNCCRLHLITPSRSCILTACYLSLESDGQIWKTCEQPIWAACVISGCATLCCFCVLFIALMFLMLPQDL